MDEAPIQGEDEPGVSQVWHGPVGIDALLADIEARMIALVGIRSRIEEHERRGPGTSPTGPPDQRATGDGAAS